MWYEYYPSRYAKIACKYRWVEEIAGASMLLILHSGVYISSIYSDCTVLDKWKNLSIIAV